MPWFFVSCVVGIATCMAADRVARTRLYRSQRFYWFQVIIAALTVMFDAVARGRVWNVSRSSTTGLELFGTPIELILFGYVMVYAVIICYEYLSAREGG